MTIQEAVNALIPTFPNTKYVQADDPQLEDDQIEMSDTYVIQLCDDRTTMVVQDCGDGTINFSMPMTLKNAVKTVLG